MSATAGSEHAADAEGQCAVCHGQGTREVLICAGLVLGAWIEPDVLGILYHDRTDEIRI